MAPSAPNPRFSDPDALFDTLIPDRRDPAALRKRVETLEIILERSFVIPGINRPVGLDAIVGLVPVVGDLITAAMGAYLIWEARNLGMPKWKIWRMIGNLGIDTALGAIPLAGDAFDFLFRSNSRNLRIIKKHLDKHHPGTTVIDQ
ncbi:MAG: DUF4112 domain-containing protein [Alphaproteobacteria bacterium HGW-Alphaproteobacteria-13]|nr:MAG: DUF4112 domain-containing protein [Alphaproteobacteria bacterium HGW-Alphaproteobacteria-13]